MANVFDPAFGTGWASRGLTRFDPAQGFFFFDDFDVPAPTQGTTGLQFFSRHQWTGYTSVAGGTITSVSPSSAGTFGELQLLSPSGNGASTTLFQGAGGGGTWGPFNNQIFDLRVRGKLNTTSNIVSYFGLISDSSPFGHLLFSINAGSFVGSCYDGTATTTLTFSAIDTNYHTFRIRAITAGNILFSMDGGTEQLSTTHLPTQSLQSYITVAATTATQVSINVDYFYLLIKAPR